MPTSNVHRSPAKMSITHLGRGETFEVQYNPTELEEEVVANWGKLKVLGLSHEVQQYANTSNHTFQLSLPMSAFDDRGNQINNMQIFRRFMLSLLYSPRGATTISGGSPSRVLFFWPKFISITCTVGRVKIKHTDFSNEGLPTRFMVEVPLEEVRDTRLYSEDVRDRGTQRSP